MWLFLRFVHFNINILFKIFSANVFKMPAFSLFKIEKNPYNAILSSHKLKKKKVLIQGRTGGILKTLKEARGTKTTLLKEEQGKESQWISCQKPCKQEESGVKYFKHWNAKPTNLECYTLGNCPPQVKKKWRFSVKQKWSEFITSRPVLQEILKKIIL